MKNPEKHEWDHFWEKDKLHVSGNLSWSKRRILGVIDPFLQKGNKVLDADCGSGFFSKTFCGRGMETVSIDYSDKALDITREITAGRARVVKYDLESNNLAHILQDTFDVIFSDGLFEHFGENGQDKVVKNFLSVLAPKGIIITFVPNRWSPWEIIRPFFMPGIEEIPFTLNGLTRLHQRNSLDVIEKGGVNTLPFRFSPDGFLGNYFGMLLYTIAKQK